MNAPVSYLELLHDLSTTVSSEVISVDLQHFQVALVFKGRDDGLAALEPDLVGVEVQLFQVDVSRPQSVGNQLGTFGLEKTITLGEKKRQFLFVAKYCIKINYTLGYSYRREKL